MEVLGDIASVLSGVGVLFQQKPFVRQFLAHGGKTEELQPTATWAMQAVVNAEASA